MRKCLVPNAPAELKYGAAISQARQVTGLEAELGADGEAVVLYLDDSKPSRDAFGLYSFPARSGTTF